MDIFDPCYAYEAPKYAKAAGIYPYFQALSSSDGPVVEVGDRKNVVMLGSNNNLGPTHPPEVLRAAHDAIERYGAGCTGSRLLNGNLDIHEMLEDELAALVGKPRALVFSAGFLANHGTVAALGAQPGTVLFSEAENHASLIDGCRLARAELRVFEDAADLERQLSEREIWPHAMVITDTVFSMTGRLLDLTEIVELKRRFGFRIYADDAHGIGVLGPQGAGACAAQGVTDDVDVIFGTFSKSLASIGGFVAADGPVIEYLRHHARTLLFSAGLPPASGMAALTALRIMRREPERFDRLWANARYLREGFEALGFHTMGTRMPIIPVLVGSESLSFRICRELLDLGVFATPVIYPAVPYGQALIRSSTMPAHTVEHLDRAIDAFGEIRKRFDIPEVDGDELPHASGPDFRYFMPDAPTP